MNVIICTEGNLNMGMGHVYRTLTLADELDYHVTFFTKSGEDVIDKIKGHGYEVVCASDDEVVFELLDTPPKKIVIFDRLDIDPSLARRIKEKGHGLVIFGSLSSAKECADIVINVIGSDFTNCSWVDGVQSTIFFQGPKYYIFKKSFFEQIYEENKPEPGRCLFLFGGADNLNLTVGGLEALYGKPGINNIDIIIGAGYHHMGSLIRTMERFSDGAMIRLYRDVENVAEIMAKAETVITSPGMSMFEAFLLKRKVIAFAQNKFQTQVFGNHFRVIESESIMNLYDIIKGNDVMDPTSKLITDMKIGQGKNEILSAIARLGERV